MADLTSTIQQGSLAGAVPTYTAVAAADFFTAQPGAKYLLHYKNGATVGTGVLKIIDATSVAPTGSSPAAGWADVQISAALPATSERVHVVPSDRFRDSNGRINLSHLGTITTISVNITQV